MSIKTFICGKLEACGLWPDEAQAVLEKMQADPANKDMGGRWGDREEGYPKELLACLWVSAENNALKWIDENKPMHFARGCFCAQ